MTRLAIVVSHPIQHFVPLYRVLAKHPGVTLKVFFASRIGVERSFDREMNAAFAWDGDLTEGYDHQFLDHAEQIDQVSFRSVNNPGVAEALRLFVPDAVLVYGYAQLTALRALLWSRLHGVPVLMAGDGDATVKPKGLRSLLRTAGLRLLMRQVSVVLTVGDQNEIFWERLGVPSTKRFRSPFPIDEKVYRHARTNRLAMRAAIRRRFDIADDATVVLFVGKLSARKRPSDLLAAATHLKSNQPVHLLFCGDGTERAALTESATAMGLAATFAGFVNLDRLPAMYCAADMLVIASEHDPHPLVGSEACAVGLPLIVSDRVGLIGETDIARPDFNALVYPCADPESLALAMQRLVDDATLHQTMAEASRAVFEETCMRHSLDGVIAALDFACRDRHLSLQGAPA